MVTEAAYATTAVDSHYGCRMQKGHAAVID